jgi:hypothetical protein
VEPLPDGTVAQPLCHQVEHLPFARGQVGEWPGRRRVGREQSAETAGDAGTEDRLARGEVPHGADDAIGRGALRDVAAGAGGHRRVHGQVIVEGGED